MGEDRWPGEPPQKPHNPDDRHTTPRKNIALRDEAYRKLDQVRALKGLRTLSSTVEWMCDLALTILQKPDETKR